MTRKPEEWSEQPLARAPVTTRHPEDYVLVDRASGDVWQMVRGSGSRPDGWKKFAGTVTVVDKRKPKMRGPKSHDELFEWLREEGFGVNLQPSGHYKITYPDGTFCASAALTPSDVRSLANSVGLLRRVTGLPLRREHR